MLVFWRTESTGAKVLHHMPTSIREALPSDDWANQSLPATPILRIAGTYLDFDKLVRIGIPGLREEIAEHLARERARGGDTVLFSCMQGVLDLFCTVCLHYAVQAEALCHAAPDEKRKMELRRISDSLRNITTRAPKSLHEAIQLAWLYGLMTPEIEYGRIDVYLGDLYVHDVDSHTITEAEALAMVQSFYRLIDHLDCETDGRVIIGGYGRRNPENADRFDLLAIQACKTVHEALPQFTLRFNHETPRSVWLASLDCIESGRTYPLLQNDDVLVPAIMHAFGVDRTRAESYVPLGCGEIEFDHYSFGSPSGALNLLKVLEIAIRGGYDPVGQHFIGPRTKPLAQCESFGEFYSIYCRHLDYYIEAEAAFEMYEYRKTGELHAFMMVSMLYDHCCESGKAIFNGGCASLNGTLELYGMINAADSLTAIRELVFDRKCFTAEELVRILDSNFFRCEKARKLMLDCPKYGNDDPVADEMVVTLQRYVSEKTRNSAKSVGLDSYLQVTINNAQNTTLARWVGASADGRKAGTSTACGNNPTAGSDKNGITAMLNSLLKMPQNNNAGTVQNLRLSREIFESSREKVHALIENYFERGGAHLMITVVGRDALAGAMAKPEEYHDLIVRVGGFSARFVNLPKDVQLEIFNRMTY